MLSSLHITDYALISELEIDFSSGFSVITGETGAGKSIIMGALSLILGERADSRFIREGAKKCVVEAEFDIRQHTLHGFFTENELDYDERQCLIRRELSSSGKSRAFINDTPVSLSQLRELTGRLIDIHSQHQNLLLSESAYQLKVVDAVAGNADLLSQYKTDFHIWQNFRTELASLKKTAEKQLADLEYIQFQYRQLADANLKEDEQKELEEEQEMLSHTEEIKRELLNVKQMLGEEQMAVHLIKNSLTSIQDISNYVLQGKEWQERLNTIYIDLKDLLDEVSTLEDRTEHDPSRLEKIEYRLSELYGFYKKFRVGSERELMDLRDEFGRKLQRIESYDSEIQELEQKIETAEKQLALSAEKLSKSRVHARNPIKEYMVSQLSQLGMPNIQFEVSITNTTQYTENGKDDIQFLFSANKNKSLLPVTQIASGGEIARLMLTLKALMANRAELPTIIFDEIDTGVSGEIAYRMGEIMREMSAEMQVITITHLPQIAAKGDAHYKVRKDETGHTADVSIMQLGQEERVNEIAQMISGKQLTEAAILQARQLLN